MANFTTHIVTGTIVSGSLATLTLAADVIAPENLVGVTMAGVTVQAAKAPLLAAIDRKVYQVGSDLLAQTGSATDVLRNIPSLEVDLDGGISLRWSHLRPDNTPLLITNQDFLKAMKGE